MYQKDDDEVVATENYFLNEPTHDGYTIIKEEIYNECDLSKKDANLKKSCEREKTAEKNKDEGLFDGTHFDRIGALDETFYFDQVRDEINNLFATFPEEKCLIKALPGSKFVRVKYSASKFYVVGVVYENQKPKYICYGVPGKYSPEPPNELKGYASFLPLSIFDLKGDGYWMLYQDAVTGDCVRINF